MWLWEKTRVQEVVGQNTSTGYQMDFYYNILW